MTTIDEVFVGDVNVPVVLTCKKKDGSIYDISAASDLKFTIKKPGGVASEVTVNFVLTGSDGQLIYVVPLMDTAGIWEVRAYLTFPGGRKQKSSDYNYRVSTP